MIDLETQFRKFEFKPKGVIHIGAHEANELETYIKLGFQKIFWSLAQQIHHSVKEERA